VKKFATMLTILGSLAIVPSASAQDIKLGLVGLWKLTGHGNKNPSTGALEHPRGQHPGGYQLFSKDGRHMFVMFDENRKKPSGPPSNADKVALFDSMLSYAGTYKVVGNKVLIHMEHDASQQVQINRTYVVDLAGNKLTLTAEPFTDAAGRRIISIRNFERVE
jgi:Lipocalin-like domain